jgi:Ternary complex associated domain 9
VKRTWKALLIVVPLLVLMVLASCAPAAPAAEESQATQAPAEVEAEAPQPTEMPIPSPTPAPTQEAAPEITATPYVEERMLELEYPLEVKKGDSDVLRLSLVYTGSAYVATTEFDDHTLDTQELPVEYVPGYALTAAARLDGAGFVLSPEGEQEQYIQRGQDATWRWSIRPQSAGRHRLSVTLLLRWVAEDDPHTVLREEQALNKALEVRVTSFLGLGRTPALLTGLAGLLLGSGMMLGTVIMRRGELPRLQTREPNPSLVIEPAPGTKLPADEAELLRALFKRYARLTLAGEFLSGYSGASTYLALPIRANGQSDAATIVKIGPRASIQQEYANYEDFVKDRLPPITARIQHAPVVLRGGDLAAMQYTFIAEPGRSPMSLRRALLDDPQPELIQAVYDTFGPSWWMQREAYTFRPMQEYDRLLPPHLVLRPVNSGRGRVTLDENTSPYAQSLQIGDVVRVAKFRQYELRADRQSLSMFGKAVGGQPPVRLRWLSTQPPANTLAEVVETQSSLFAGYVAGFERFGLPDPLECLAGVLAEPIQGTRSVIHGDLNLENVLVGPGGLVWLIDFAETRNGHPLFDFARLGAEVIAHILAVREASPAAYLETLQSGGDPLWQAVQEVGRRCLFNPSNPREMDVAQYLACLGALKFSNLSEHARHCLYLTAGEISKGL